MLDAIAVRRAPTSGAARSGWRARGLLAFALLALGCESEPPSSFSFYEDRIDPILEVGCQRQTTGCHVDDGRGFALGNLDLTSYDSLMRRRDVLPAYGPYSAGVLLLKAGNPIDVNVRTIDPPDPANPELRRVRITTDIRHAAGEGAIARGSRGYAALKQWIDGGFARTGVPARHMTKSLGNCMTGVPARLDGIDLDAPLLDESSFQEFVRDVQPILKERCAGSVCHGNSNADLVLTCGDSSDELRWNYEVAVRFLDEVPATSELLRRPLANIAGGVFHEGGDVFADVNDSDYREVLAWASSTIERTPELLEFGEADDGLRFFGNRVQPVLVRKGCMFLNCHSPSMFHDLRLRGGASGSFSSIATRRNYEMARALLAVDSADPQQSRLIAKNLCPPSADGRGIPHRGGALFEDFGGCSDASTRAGTDKCADVDADSGDLNQIPGYCVLSRWHAIERAAAIARGALPDRPEPNGVVFITRPEGIGGVLDFHTFRPGADLLLASASVAANGELSLGAPHSLLAGCGLTSPDIRGTAVSWDARRIAFAARSSASAPLRIYELNADGSGCAQKSALNPSAAEQDGILLHDFDPTYAPDGRLVFASTRGNIAGASDIRGPSRTPASLAPNANLYVFETEPAPSVRQLTFLLNQELAPSFMMDGRVIFTAEKRAQDFHQLAARRMNLDGGDYHPLIAQRASVGFQSATEVVELPNRNLAFVGAGLDAADGGGAIVIVNRSIGPDQDDRDPSDRSYVHSLSQPIPGVFGGANGVYRSPAPLPSGRLIAACDPAATDVAGRAHHYGLCELDAALGGRPRVLWTDASRIALEPQPLWAREPHAVFESRSDEANGSTRVEPSGDDAIVHYLDVPLLGTLLFSNTREGRPIRSDVGSVKLFEARPPPADADSFGQLGGRVVTDAFGEFYAEYRELGNADLEEDGSLRARVPGGVPLVLELGNEGGEALTFGRDAPFNGPLRQREEMQFYPGERAKQSMPRRLFNGVCGGCHGSVSGRELDIAVDVDLLTSASRTMAGDDLVDLR